MIPENHKKRMKKTLPNKYTPTGDDCEECGQTLVEELHNGDDTCSMCG